MIKKTTFILFLVLSFSVFGSEHSQIDTLGISTIGHVVAIEEYGYIASSHSYYVNIKFLNVWTKEYVGKTIKVELPALNKAQLQDARKKAKFLATEDLKKFKISS